MRLTHMPWCPLSTTPASSTCRWGRIALAYLCAAEADTEVASAAIGDSVLRVVEILTEIRP